MLQVVIDEQLNQQFNQKETRWSNCSPLYCICLKSNINQQLYQHRRYYHEKVDLELIQNNTNNIVAYQRELKQQIFNIFMRRNQNNLNYQAVIRITIKISNQSQKLGYSQIFDPNFHIKRFDWNYLNMIVKISYYLFFLSKITIIMSIKNHFL
ncbi:unnamed protein product [Paramecium primaurelia]|uniref:Transmembrane protein n=1 Tax=Paramecium primaurelia TaxID=5886 RepID=A0A8S1NGJ2_PARPR|nr:unnamed protein product [Paramecium primaurelia]